MRALVYTAPRLVVIEDRPRPLPSGDEIEIAVDAAGICGADMAGFLGRSRARIPPLILGHELVGRGPDGRRVVANPLLCCGRCPACLKGAQNLCSNWRLLGLGPTQGCHAEFVAVPERQLYEIPEEMTDSRALLAEPLANIVHLFRIAAPPPSFRLGIVGAGTMGSLALQTALRLGAREILVEDICEPRMDAARQMGATVAANVSTEEGRGQAREFAADGLDLVLDACGTGAARQAAFGLCRPGGTVVLLGMAAGRCEIDFDSSIRRELRAIASFAYTPADFERSLVLLAAGEIGLAPWTVEMPLEEGQAAFEKMAGAPGATLKMVLRVR